jgi:hypothetical protein
MRDADDKDEEFLLPYRVDDDIVLADVDTTQLGAANQLFRPRPPGMLGQKIKPAEYALANVTGQAHQLPMGTGGELDAVGHRSGPQVPLDLLQGNGLPA